LDAKKLTGETPELEERNPDRKSPKKTKKEPEVQEPKVCLTKRVKVHNKEEETVR